MSDVSDPHFDALRAEYRQHLQVLKDLANELSTEIRRQRNANADELLFQKHLPIPEQISAIQGSLNSLIVDAKELVAWMRLLVPVTDRDQLPSRADARYVSDYVGRLRLDPASGYASDLFRSKAGQDPLENVDDDGLDV